MVISTAESALSEEIIQNSGLLHPQDYFITSREVRERGWRGGRGHGADQYVSNTIEHLRIWFQMRLFYYSRLNCMGISNGNRFCDVCSKN